MGEYTSGNRSALTGRRGFLSAILPVSAASSSEEISTEEYRMAQNAPMDRRGFLGGIPLLGLCFSAEESRAEEESSLVNLLGETSGRRQPRIDYSRIPVPKVGYHPINPEPDYRGIQLADEEGGYLGRLQRSLRWRPVTKAVERRYGIPENILLAMIMQESFGNPIQPNMQMDGGLGLMHMQPVVAHNYGLDVYGNEHVLDSRRYGRRLNQMLRECKWDMRCIMPKDDRIHPVINLDCGGRIVMTGYQTHRSWPSAVKHYFLPGFQRPKFIRLGQRYWNNVNRFLSASRNQEAIRQAREDFNGRNAGFMVRYPNGTRRPASFDRYLGDFEGICENYGLPKYGKLARVPQ